jgi:hypothetical protein
MTSAEMIFDVVFDQFLNLVLDIKNLLKKQVFTKTSKWFLLGFLCLPLDNLLCNYTSFISLATHTKIEEVKKVKSLSSPENSAACQLSPSRVVSCFFSVPPRDSIYYSICLYLCYKLLSF